MAKVTIDVAACTGCGLCAASCPDVFEINTDNKAIVKSEESSSCDINQVASECPVNAIIVG